MDFLELPLDIHESIADQLVSNVPGPLFAPIYKKQNDNIGVDGDLENKCIENYGKRDDDQLAAAQALLHWSVTCRHFRKLLAPRLFKSVVLRSRPKSVASIKALRDTPHWNLIESFSFVATEHEYDEHGNIELREYGRRDKNEIAFTNVIENGEAKYSLEAEMSELRDIMSRLPPNIKSVTLDFPNGWDYDWAPGLMEDGVFYDNQDEECLRYRGQLQIALEAISSNDISAKPEFELKLLSVPIVYCPAYDSDYWHEFLMKITSLTLALCHWDNGAGWNLNVYSSGAAPNGSPTELTTNLPTFFLNHLKSVKRLHVYGDGSWPLGESPCEMHQVDVVLPNDPDRMPALEHVSFKQFFICDTLQDFLLAHLPNLKSIDLKDCFAAGEYEPEKDPPQEPNWATLFSALAIETPRKLEQFTISNPSRSLVDIMGGDRAHDRKKDDDPVVVAREKMFRILAAQKSENSPLTETARHRQVLAHVTVDDKYGMILDTEEVNVSVFLKEDAHRQWLRLVDLMEENKKRAVDESALSRTIPQSPLETALRSRRGHAGLSASHAQ